MHFDDQREMRGQLLSVWGERECVQERGEEERGSRVLQLLSGTVGRGEGERGEERTPGETRAGAPDPPGQRGFRGCHCSQTPTDAELATPGTAATSCPLSLQAES